MTSRSKYPEGTCGIGKAAEILGITVRALEYLCKQKRVKFEKFKSGRKMFYVDLLKILPKNSPEASNTSSIPTGYTTVKEAANILQKSTQSIYRLVKSGKIKFCRLGSRSIYVDPTTFNALPQKDINIPPTISEPDPYDLDLVECDTLIELITKPLKEVAYRLTMEPLFNGDLPREEMIAYCKNTLMFKIQNLSFEEN